MKSFGMRDLKELEKDHCKFNISPSGKTQLTPTYVSSVGQWQIWKILILPSTKALWAFFQLWGSLCTLLSIYLSPPLFSVLSFPDKLVILHKTKIDIYFIFIHTKKVSHIDLFYIYLCPYILIDILKIKKSLQLSKKNKEVKKECKKEIVLYLYSLFFYSMWFTPFNNSKWYLSFHGWTLQPDTEIPGFSQIAVLRVLTIEEDLNSEWTVTSFPLTTGIKKNSLK